MEAESCGLPFIIISSQPQSYLSLPLSALVLHKILFGLPVSITKDPLLRYEIGKEIVLNQDAARWINVCTFWDSGGMGKGTTAGKSLCKGGRAIVGSAEAVL